MRSIILALFIFISFPLFSQSNRSSKCCQHLDIRYAVANNGGLELSVGFDYFHFALPLGEEMKIYCNRIEIIYNGVTISEWTHGFSHATLSGVFDDTVNFVDNCGTVLFSYGIE